MNRKFLRLSLAAGLIGLLLIGFVSGCESVREKKPEAVTEPEKPRLPIEEQEKIAMKEFEDMLNLTADRPRHEAFPELEKRYYKLIEEAPDTYLAEESHYRLIIQYFEDPNSPQPDKAEEVYRKYFERYENPRIGFAINTTMARLYYNYEIWDRLASFMVPFIRKYVNTGQLREPLFLFYYSEAKFHLKEYDEALRGYRMLIREQPGKFEVDYARRRIREISHHLNPRINMKEQ